MKQITTILKSTLLLLLVLSSFNCLNAQSNVSVDANVDIVSRYIWRGMDFGNSPSIQPGLTLNAGKFSIGAWGAYTLSNNAAASDEIDLWASYTHEFKNSVSFTLLLTDYYFPNAGTKFFNFNNYDHEDGAGAHTLELGASISGGEKLPLSFSAYYNFHNDAGNSSYLEVAYSTAVQNVSLDLFCGAAIGSEDNPGYYGTDSFDLINIGVTATKEIKVTEDFKLPLFVSYIVNPNIERSYLVLGFSL